MHGSSSKKYFGQMVKKQMLLGDVITFSLQSSQRNLQEVYTDVKSDCKSTESDTTFRELTELLHLDCDSLCLESKA